MQSLVVGVAPLASKLDLAGVIEMIACTGHEAPKGLSSIATARAERRYRIKAGAVVVQQTKASVDSVIEIGSKEEEMPCRKRKREPKGK